MSELKRCPFCGGEARMHKTAFLKYEVEVVCKNCGARTLTHSSASFSDANMNAIKAWNTRKPMERIVERLEEKLRLAEEEKDRCAIKALPYYDNVKGYATGMHNAIEIAKEEGGMNEKV